MVGVVKKFGLKDSIVPFSWRSQIFELVDVKTIIFPETVMEISWDIIDAPDSFEDFWKFSVTENTNIIYPPDAVVNGNVDPM